VAAFSELAMWAHVLMSIALLLTSLLYHYHFSEPASVIDYPETHYDYIVGEFASSFTFAGPPDLLALRPFRFLPLLHSR